MPKNRLFCQVEPELEFAITELDKHFDWIQLKGTDEDVSIQFAASETSKIVVQDQVTVYYSRKIDAFRALGLIRNNKLELDRTYSLPNAFSTCGVMIDVSRSAVLKLDMMKYLVRLMAVLGLNTLQLYTEDIYKVPSQPFFGYGRGVYSAQELKEIDDYCCHFGIEAFPCIQTLGHLGQILQWPTYSSIRE